MQRRKFISRIGWGTALLTSSNFSLHAFGDEPEFERLTILHTNDVHSRIDPFPMDGGRNEGLGGAAKRAALIKNIRKEVNQVLLLDSGDIFQGTPYFNFFGGELEMKLMTQMGYDAGTMGNHDFDAGVEGFEKQMIHANFPFIVSNYNFDDSALKGKIAPYKIIKKGDLKIGVLGLGIELDGLVPDKLYDGVHYLDPMTNAQKTADLLKEELKCDYVICLSHLGYRYKYDKVSDVIIAENSRNIDLILGGHTHTFMKEADVYSNKDGKEILVSQAGWAGIMLGRIDLIFEKTNGAKCITCGNSIIS